MTVLIVISDLEFGGAQRQVVELVNQMDPKVCRLHVVSLSDFVPLAKSLRSPDNLSVILRRSRFDFSVVPRLARVIRQLKADVVHCFLFDATIAARLASCLSGRPAVISSERNTDYKVKRTDFLFLKATRRLDDLVIANSRAGALFNSRLFDQPIERYRVIHNGVDVNRFALKSEIVDLQPAIPSALQSQIGNSQSQIPLVGMFASFKPQKNHLCWLRAAKRVLERVPDLKLLFVGDALHKGGSDSTAFKQTISRTVEQLGLKDRCLFVGNKPDVENYYPLCALTVLPSLFEGTPNVALESMSCGVPVVASDVSDNSYIVRDGQTGFVVPLDDEAALADRVCKILLDAGLRQKLSRQAREWAVSEFSCARLAEKTLAVYHEALALCITRRVQERPAVSKRGPASDTPASTAARGVRPVDTGRL